MELTICSHVSWPSVSPLWALHCRPVNIQADIVLPLLYFDPIYQCMIPGAKVTVKFTRITKTKVSSEKALYTQKPSLGLITWGCPVITWCCPCLLSVQGLSAFPQLAEITPPPFASIRLCLSLSITIFNGLCSIVLQSSCTRISQYIYEGGPPKTAFIYKKLYIYSYMLSFSHLQSTLHLMQYTY